MNLGERAHGGIDQLCLPVEPALPDLAGVTLDSRRVRQVGKHNSLAKIIDHIHVCEDGDDLLLEPITQIVKVRRSGDEVFVVD